MSVSKKLMCNSSTNNIKTLHNKKKTVKKNHKKTNSAINILGFRSLNAATKLHEKLKIAGWSNLLKTFVLSSEFVEIVQQLSQYVEQGKRFSPSLKEMFKCFELCPFDKVKVVIVGTEPQTQIGVADGLAFSGKKSNQQSSEFLSCIKAGFSDELSFTSNNSSLTILAEQGVLLLNIALTSEIDKNNRHIKLWQPFTSYLLDMLSIKRPDLVWVFHGKLPYEMSSLVKTGIVIKTKEIEDWQKKDVCKNVNSELLKLRLQPILW